MIRIFLLVLTVSLAAQTGPDPSGLSPQEQRGRQVYEFARSPTGGAIEARIAGGSRVPGSIMPCANCHGYDGTGKPEGGLTPSNLTWKALTKPYGVTHADGRTHPPYNEHLLKRAITMGIDPAGNALSVAMPRYSLSLTDVSDLVTYMKRLGDVIDPGVTATTVRIGVILRVAFENATIGSAMRQALSDYFEHVNTAGGIFNRQIELTFSALPSDPAQRPSALRCFLHDQRPFAVLGDFTGAETEIASVLRETGTPAIATLAPLPEPSLPLSAYVFYLDGGLKDEMDSLLHLVGERYPGRNLSISIVVADEDISRQAAIWLQARLSGLGRQSVTMSNVSDPVDADLVFCLEPVVELHLKRAAVVLIPGSMAEIPPAFPRIPSTRVFVALGAASVPESPAFRSTERMIWNRASASAALMVEAMRIAGRDLSRNALLEAMESFRQVRTELGLPVSFGPTRRTGANGAKLMMLDVQRGRLVPA